MTRIISRHPERANPDERWEGYLPDCDPEQPEVWPGPNVEAVIHRMNKDLGEVDESKYVITE